MKHTASFTLIEMMAASTVLSLVLLLMVGMQDQMSRAWTNANRRADATREASAACRLMAQDLSCLVFRSLATDTASSKQFAAGLSNQGVPFLYSSNGSVPVTFSIPSNQPGAAYFFAVTTRIPSTADPTDLSIVGYYIASETRTNLNGFSSTSYNLYRYYAPGTNAISNLKEWFNLPTDARKPTNLFKPNITNDEILARNTCNLRITVYNRIDGKSDGSSNRVANGLNYQFISGGGGTYYSGSKLQVEMSVYPEEFAQKIPYTSWTNSNNIKKYARSYEFRVDIPRD